MIQSSSYIRLNAFLLIFFLFGLGGVNTNADVVSNSGKKTDIAIYPQIGHGTDEIYSLDFSPSGKRLLSCNSKKMVLWDVESGREIRSFNGHFPAIFVDENRIAGYMNQKIHLFRPDKAEPIKIIGTHPFALEKTFTPGIVGLSLSSDRRRLISYIYNDDYDSKLKKNRSEYEFIIWDTQSFKKVKSEKGSIEGGGINYASISKGNRFYIGNGNTLICYNLDNGKKENEIILGKEQDAVAAVITPNADKLITISPEEKGLMRVYNLGKKVSLYKTVKNRFLGDCPVLGCGPSNFSISPDGKLFLMGQFVRHTFLWDISKGEKRFLIKDDLSKSIGKYSNSVSAVAFSKDQNYFASGYADGAITIWNTDSGKKKLSLYNNIVAIHGVGYDKKLKNMAIQTSKLNDFSVQISHWDLTKGVQTKMFSNDIPPGHAGAMAVTPNGRLGVSQSTWGRDDGWWCDGYAEISPSGRYILSYSGALIWDIEKGKKLGDLYKAGYYDYRKTNLVLYDTKLKTHRELPDIFESVFIGNEHILGRSKKDKGYPKLWDIKTGHVFKSYSLPPKSGSVTYRSMKGYSPDGKIIIYTEGKETRYKDGKKKGKVKFRAVDTYIFSLALNRILKVIKNVEIGKVAFSLSGRLFILNINRNVYGKDSIFSGGKSLTEFWDIATLQRKRIIHEGWARYYGFSDDDKKIILVDKNNVLHLRDTATGNELLKVYLFRDEEWIAITPEGYYNASQYGHKYLSIRYGNRVAGINQFYDVFYRPDIVEAKLKGEKIDDLIELTIDEAVKYPPPDVKIATVPGTSKKKEVTVDYQVQSTGGGIGDIRVYQNGKLVQSDKTVQSYLFQSTSKTNIQFMDSKAIVAQLRSIASKSGLKLNKTEQDRKSSVAKPTENLYKGKVEITTVPGLNEVSIVAFNLQNSVHSMIKSVSFKSNRPSELAHLFVLCIGINDYLDDDPNTRLNFAVKDAKNIGEMLKKQSNGLYDTDKIHVRYLMDQDASKNKIIKEFKWLASRIKPTDTFILFFAGHGIMDGHQYYLVTHDYDGKIQPNSMISTNELLEQSKNVPALTQLLILDSCYAGGVDYIVRGLYDSRMSVLAKKMGLHIFASASDLEKALDSYEGNGLFSHILLQGLNNNPKVDENKDKLVSLKELGKFSKRLTTDIAKKLGHEQEPLIKHFGEDKPVYRIAQ
jgi:WD40 repeat protein